jgi:hypothetical protein
MWVAINNSAKSECFRGAAGGINRGVIGHLAGVSTPNRGDLEVF